MAKLLDVYSYQNPRFAPLREPMRNLIGAWGNAEKWFATLKEWPLIEMGMPHFSDIVHKLEHIQPERLDVWADAYRPWHLPLEYPATPELAEEITDMDRLFEVCIGIVDEVDVAMSKVIHAFEDGEFDSLAQVTENLRIENQADKVRLMNLWALWDSGVNPAAFDLAAKELSD